MLESHKSVSNPLVTGFDQLKVYLCLKAPMDLVPVLPVFQIDYGQSATLPLVSADVCGFSGSGSLLLTHTVHHNEMVYNASLQKTSLQIYGIHSFQNFKFLTDFNASFCDVYSHQLEQLAVACPKLQRLNLENGGHCLDSLKG